MIKVGDRVTLFDNITQEGVVVALKEKTTRTWLVGGVSSPKIIAIVKWDDDKEGNTEGFSISRLMRLE